MQLQRADNRFKEGTAIGVLALIAKLSGANDAAWFLTALAFAFMAIAGLLSFYLNHIKPMH